MHALLTLLILPASAATWYADVDADGYGDPDV